MFFQEYANGLTQRCCVCHTDVNPYEGLRTTSQLTEYKNDVYHLHCRDKYYQLVKDKYNK